MSDDGWMKRYFAVILHAAESAKAAMLAGSERDGVVITHADQIGFGLDYYPEEREAYREEFGAAIIGDYPTRAHANAAIRAKFAEQAK